MPQCSATRRARTLAFLGPMLTAVLLASAPIGAQAPGTPNEDEDDEDDDDEEARRARAGAATACLQPGGTGPGRCCKRQGLPGRFSCDG